MPLLLAEDGIRSMLWRDVPQIHQLTGCQRWGRRSGLQNATPSPPISNARAVRFPLLTTLPRVALENGEPVSCSAVAFPLAIPAGFSTPDGCMASPPGGNRPMCSPLPLPSAAIPPIPSPFHLPQERQLPPADLLCLTAQPHSAPPATPALVLAR
jgi:hypothetical protein